MIGKRRQCAMLHKLGIVGVRNSPREERMPVAEGCAALREQGMVQVFDWVFKPLAGKGGRRGKCKRKSRLGLCSGVS